MEGKIIEIQWKDNENLVSSDRMVEFFYKSGSRDICERFLRTVSIGISFLLDEILETIVNTLGVEDSPDFEVFLIILDIRRWR